MSSIALNWSTQPRVMGWLPGLAGMATLSILALGAGALEERVVGQAVIEPLVVALLLGVVARNVAPAAAIERCKAGANLAAKQILELGVLLLGASVVFQEILRAGPALLALIVGGVLASIVVSFSIGRTLSLGTRLALLVAVGNSICGNSAIAALAPAIDADRKDVASAIGLTAVIGVCLVLGLPLLIGPLQLSLYQYGVLAGMSVYAVPQVVAAAYPVSQLSGNVATLVKLTRVVLLGPVVLIVSALYRMSGGRPAAAARIGSFVPWFVIGFFVLAVVRSSGVLPEGLSSSAQLLSRLLTIMAMAGLGFGVEIAAVRKVGARVGVAVVLSLTFMASFTVLAIRLAGLEG